MCTKRVHYELLEFIISFICSPVVQKSHHEVEKDNIFVHVKHDNVKYNNILW